MKNFIVKCAVASCCMLLSMPAMAQFNLKKAVQSAGKVAKAATLTDEQMREYV